MEPKKVYEYEIGGRLFIQRPLVLGQVRLLIAEFEGSEIPPDMMLSPMNILNILGDRMNTAIAIVLIEKEATSLKDRNLTEVADFFDFNLDIPTTLQVVDDFFDCNPISLLLTQFNNLIRKITVGMSMETETGSLN